MVEDGCVVIAEVATKFFNSVYLRGLYQNASSSLRSVTIATPGAIANVAQAGGPHHLTAHDPTISSWEVQLLLERGVFPDDAVVQFTTEAGTVHKFAVSDLLIERELTNATGALGRSFFEQIAAPNMKRILDLGGRDRSKKGVWLYQDQHDVTVFDIIDEPGVNVVGDAHELSRHFPANYFDAIHCISVLEHIAMPWKVAVEVAKVLRPGGIGFFQTHQTVGMHDLPWDFWRVSEFAWDALFNRQTGFSVEERAMAHECFIIPFRWRQGIEFEKAAGFESSAVLVKKVGEPTVDWPIPLNQIMKTMYPSDKS